MLLGTHAISLLLLAGAFVPGQVFAQDSLGLSAANAAVVEVVVPGSIAASAGVMPGDVLMEIDGQPVHSAQDLANVKRMLQPGKRIAITVSRAGRRLQLAAPAQAAASAAAPAAPAKPVSGGPPLGHYGCTHRWYRGTAISGEWETELKGGFELMPGGRYRYLDGGEVGTYSYDPQTRKLAFKRGHFGNGDAWGEYTPRGAGAQIDIVFPTSKSPIRWMCGMNP